MDWSPFYPHFVAPVQVPGLSEDGNEGPEDAAEASLRKLSSHVEILDIGCGFGGLLMALSPLFPNKIMLGRSILCLRACSR